MEMLTNGIFWFAVFFFGLITYKAMRFADKHQYKHNKKRKNKGKHESKNVK